MSVKKILKQAQPLDRTKERIEPEETEPYIKARITTKNGKKCIEASGECTGADNLQMLVCLLDSAVERSSEFEEHVIKTVVGAWVIGGREEVNKLLDKLVEKE